MALEMTSMGPRTTRTSAKARAPLATITNRNGSTTVPALLADSVCLSPDLLKLISEHFTEPCEEDVEAREQHGEEA